MPRFVDIQTNFSTGELDPLLRSRIDLAQYNNALAKATNVVVQPQGGIRRRPGLKHIAELPNTAANGVRLVPFEFSVDDSYMLCFVNERMYVFKDGVQITAINGGADPYLTTTITSAMLSQLHWTQSADTMFIVHPDLAPAKLVRGGSDSSWTISTVTFDNVPKYAFNLDSHTNNSETLTPSAVSGNITLTTTSSKHDTGTAQAGASTTITLKSASSATDDYYNGLYITITGGTGSGQIRIIEDYVGSTKVATVDRAWTTTPNNTSTYSITSFTTESVNQYINAQPQGRARIVRYVSATVVEAVTEYPFFSAAATIVAQPH